MRTVVLTERWLLSSLLSSTSSSSSATATKRSSPASPAPAAKITETSAVSPDARAGTAASPRTSPSAVPEWTRSVVAGAGSGPRLATVAVTVTDSPGSTVSGEAARAVTARSGSSPPRARRASPVVNTSSPQLPSAAWVASRAPAGDAARVETSVPRARSAR